MSDDTFVPLVKGMFEFAVAEFGFRVRQELESGKICLVEFERETHVLSIGYEPGEDYLTVVLFRKLRSGLSPFDDRRLTKNISDMNLRYSSRITAIDRQENERVFCALKPNNRIGRKVLKVARETRLCLIKLAEDAWEDDAQ